VYFAEAQLVCRVQSRSGARPAHSLLLMVFPNDCCCACAGCRQTCAVISVSTATIVPVILKLSAPVQRVLLLLLLLCLCRWLVYLRCSSFQCRSS
jgi:hypothetical protein